MLSFGGWAKPLLHHNLLLWFCFSPPCGMWYPSSLTRDQTSVPCTGSTEFQPLDHQGRLCCFVYPGGLTVQPVVIQEYCSSFINELSGESQSYLCICMELPFWSLPAGPSEMGVKALRTSVTVSFTCAPSPQDSETGSHRKLLPLNLPNHSRKQPCLFSLTSFPHRYVRTSLAERI